MLTAFTAQPILELKPRDKSKIESLVTYTDRIFIGLNNGSLRVYRVNDAASAKAVELLREEEKFSRYRIEQLAVIKEARLLVSLSNGTVSLHDSQSYELQESLAKTKGATAFAVTSNIVKDQGIPAIVSRLAVAVKRRLLLWAWQDSELIVEAEELTLVTGIKTLMWADGTRLVAGLSNSYVLVNAGSSEVVDVVGPGSIGGGPGQDLGRFGGVGVASMGYMGMGGPIPKPLATRLAEGQVLLAKDINTHFMTVEGEPLGRRQIPWALAPEAIGYSHPFLLSLQAARGLEIRNPETLMVLQTVSVPNATQIHVPPPNVSLGHAGKGFLVSSERCVWRMVSTGYDAQIGELFETAQYDEAISILSMLEDALLTNKPGRLREARILKAQMLFDQKKYRESLDEFRDAPAPPPRVIALYPAVISGNIKDLSMDANDEKTPEEMVQSDEDETKRPSTPKKGKTVPAPGSPRSNESKKSQKTTILGNLIGHKENGESHEGQQRKLEGKDLKSATMELASFLVNARTKLQRYLNFDGTLKIDSDVLKPGSEEFEELNKLFSEPVTVDESLPAQIQRLAKIIDTTLFRAYMLASPSMAGPLFRLPNFCDAEVVQQRLLDTKRYNDLVDFLYGKRLHAQALDLLARFGQGNEVEDAPEQLKGPQRTVASLQNLGPNMIDLILQYSEWPIREDADLGMDVFLADTENSETLPRDKILDFLKRINNDLVIKYLEHIILELNDGSPDFNQLLIEDYLTKLKSGLSDQDKEELQRRILRFLRTSEHYEQWKVLRTMSRDDPDLFEIRAVVLGNIGEHRQALTIYVFDMDAPEKAEEYCNQAYLKQTSSAAAKSQEATLHPIDDETPSVYQILLSLYLSPPPPHEAQWGPALDILTRHGSRLPASASLGLIPEVIPIEALEAYFTARIRAGNAILNDARVTAGLRKTVDLREDAKLRLGEGRPGGHLGRNRNVLVTEERVCRVCHKRFGGSATKVLPELVFPVFVKDTSC